MIHNLFRSGSFIGYCRIARFPSWQFALMFASVASWKGYKSCRRGLFPKMGVQVECVCATDLVGEAYVVSLTGGNSSIWRVNVGEWRFCVKGWWCNVRGWCVIVRWRCFSVYKLGCVRWRWWDGRNVWRSEARAREKVSRATSPLAVESGLQQCTTCEYILGGMLSVVKVESGDTLFTLFLN